MFRMMALACAVWVALGGGAHALAIGEVAPKATFKDIRYLPKALEDLAPAAAFALVFFQEACADSRAMAGALAALDAEYAARDVLVVGVNANAKETVMDAAYFGLRHGWDFPVMTDFTGDIAKAFGVAATPAAVVLDADQVLRYRGAAATADPARLDALRASLDAVLAGERPAPAERPVKRTPVQPLDIPEPEAAVTYAEHIAPILQEHCVQCHRPGQTAPFSLLTYNQAAARADMVKETVLEERMPPWYAHPDHGAFVNDRRMPEEEKRKIAQWVKAGMPTGDLDAAPAPPEYDDDDWLIDPDVVIEARQPVTLPATGFVPYMYVSLPYEFEEDTWVQGVEIRAENPRVLHHANLFYTTGQFAFNIRENFLTGTVPGGNPSELRDTNIAMLIPKGAQLRIQCHYVTTGRIEQDRIRVGLRFAKETVQKRMRYIAMQDRDKLEIPPHARGYRFTDDGVLEHDATGVGLFGHMHLRGRDMRIIAHYPDGNSETLIAMPNYNFDWQITYIYEHGSYRAPAGTRIETIAHYDNSRFNPYNPDPDVTVRSGPQTVDEMMNGFFVYTRDDEQLNIKVDPNTGYALTQEAAAR